MAVQWAAGAGKRETRGESVGEGAEGGWKGADDWFDQAGLAGLIRFYLLVRRPVEVSAVGAEGAAAPGKINAELPDTADVCASPAGVCADDKLCQGFGPPRAAARLVGPHLLVVPEYRAWGQEHRIRPLPGIYLLEAEANKYFPLVLPLCPAPYSFPSPSSCPLPLPLSFSLPPALFPSPFSFQLPLRPFSPTLAFPSPSSRPLPLTFPFLCPLSLPPLPFAPPSPPSLPVLLSLALLP